MHNSQSEDTVYSQLVKQRQEFEKARADGVGDCQNDQPLVDHDQNGQELEGSSNNASNDSSINTSNNSEPINRTLDSSKSTDETDKGLIMDKFVRSPFDCVDCNSDSVSDRAPSPKRQRSDQPRQKKRFTVEEYTKRKEREHRREQERREKERKQKSREREIERKKEKAKDK